MPAARSWTNRAPRTRSLSILSALALLLVLAGDVEARSARPSVSLSAVASGADVIGHARIVLHGSKRSARWRAVLQQRTVRAGHTRWRDRASAAVRASTLAVRWRRPGAGIRSVVRVSVVAGNRVLARSNGVRVVRARPVPVAGSQVGTTPAARPPASRTPIASAPDPIPGPADDLTPARGAVVAISAGAYHACALRSVGAIECWGGNESGQMGNGTFGHSLTPEPVLGIDDAVAVAAGSSHSCALLVTGSVQCWGFGGAGQLGTGRLEGGAFHSYIPVDVVGLTDVVAIAPGSLFTCALRATGTVACWGDGGRGQLGNGNLGADTSPSAVSGVRGAVAITAGSDYACALLATGTVDCWGDAGFGSLGTGSYTADGTLPAQVVGVTNAVAISASYLHTCALLATGSIACWGSNHFGALGDGTTDDGLTAVAVTGIDDATAIGAGSLYSCALRAAGTASCWGYNDVGQLGDGAKGLTPQSFTPVPVTVSGLAGATAITTGGGDACALLAAATVDCWGLNDRGQFGNGTETSSSTPVEVSLAP